LIPLASDVVYAQPLTERKISPQSHTKGHEGKSCSLNIL
jgi:hypothetical protein